MSQLRVSSIASNAGTQSVTQDRLYRGAATVWCNWNGTGTVAIRDSYNVSSITDNGTGTYTVNFQTALANTNYTPISTGGQNAVQNPGSNTAFNRATTSCAVVHWEAPGAADINDLYIAIFGGY